MPKKEKPQNSPIAHFHRKMAGAKQLTIDQLAAGMQQAVLAAQKSVVANKIPLRVSIDYVKALLYGRRPMPHQWQVAVATILGLTLADYERQRAEVTREPAVAVQKAAIVPIEYWPHFKWASKYTAPRKIAALLYGLSKDGITPKLQIRPGQWQAPAGFSGYNELRNTAWQEFSRNYSRMKKEPPIPKPIWHVAQIDWGKESVVRLNLQQADFRDVLVTGNYQGLNFNIVTDANEKCRVEEWLSANWKPGDLSQPVLPGARQLVVNLMVISKDGRAVLSRQGPDNPDSAGSWCPSVSVVVNPKLDCDNLMNVDLPRAVSRGCKEELGLNTDGRGVHWLTVVAGLKYGSITLFGVLHSDTSCREIEESVKKNVKQLQQDPTHLCQVTSVEFLKISPMSVGARLKIFNYRPYLEVGLALLLWKQGDADILDGRVGKLSEPIF